MAETFEEQFANQHLAEIKPKSTIPYFQIVVEGKSLRFSRAERWRAFEGKTGGRGGIRTRGTDKPRA